MMQDQSSQLFIICFRWILSSQSVDDAQDALVNFHVSGEDTGVIASVIAEGTGVEVVTSSSTATRGTQIVPLLVFL